MDFSEPQANAFCQAFAQVFTEEGDRRSFQELLQAAQEFIKGCKNHYLEAVNQVSRLGAIVPSEQAPQFKRMMHSLLETTSPAEFSSGCDAVIRHFPRTANHVNWWRRPKVAQKLFLGVRSMEPELWDSMAQTNNAEEAMHS